MKEIVVISGKGGTGKTSLTASFSFLGGDSLITADCDVDAADMHLLLEPDFGFEEDFFSGEEAVIDQEKCISCGKCAAVCRFGAVIQGEQEYQVDKLSCEGCGYCCRMCPARAISMEPMNVGKWYASTIKTGGKMVHACLGIGAENSGKLVAKVKQEARAIANADDKAIVLVDGSPGIGCPVVSSLSGADYVVFVTEPSVSGSHDLKRVYQLVKKFRIPSGCIINKADINPIITSEIEEFLKNSEIDYIAALEYDEDFTVSMTQGKTITEYANSSLSEKVRESWKKITRIIQNKGE
ncbi:MAG: ATP-binding protein [Spirochaetia bacterium]